MSTPSPCFFSALLLLFCQHAWTIDDRCIPSDSAVIKYTCSFPNVCAWENNNDNKFDWEEYNVFFNYFITQIWWRNKDEMAGLQSLPICSSIYDEYILQFDYLIALERNNICQLSVDLLGLNNASINLLRTQDNTSRFTHFSGNITFNYSFQIVFKAISLQRVKKRCLMYITFVTLTHKTVTTLPPTSKTTVQTTSNPHSDTSQTPEPPAAKATQSTIIWSSPTSAASLTTTISASASPEKSVTPSNTAQQNPQAAAKSQDGVPAGAVTGIVVGVVVLVIIVVVCTVVILVARRRASGGEVHLPWIFKNLFRHSGKAEPRNGVFAVENSAYVCDDNCIPVREYPMKEPLQNDAPNCNRANSSVFGDYYSVPHDSPGNDPGASATSDYAVADGSSDYYAMPVNDTSDVKTKTEFNPHVNVATGAVNTISGRKGVKQKRGDTTEYELAAVIGSDAGYSTPDDVDLKAGRRELQSTGRTHVDGTKRNDYNKLSFQTPSSAAVKNTQDTYNHLQEQDNVYNVPRGDDSEYSPAGNPDKAGAQLAANAAQNHRYENVDERGKPVSAVEAGTEYNHLNIKTGHPSVTESRSPPSDVYNHLDETVQGQPSLQADDEYNKVDFNGRTREADEADEDGTYNHLDTLQD